MRLSKKISSRDNKNVIYATNNPIFGVVLQAYLPKKLLDAFCLQAYIRYMEKR